MIRLTRWIIALTVALGVVAGLQLWTMLKGGAWCSIQILAEGEWFTSEWYRQGKENREAILDHAERLSDLIRERLNSLAIVPDGQMREERER